jgi:DUF1680 family protein
LYCAGHLIQAAVAWQAHAHDDRLLRISERLLEHVLRIFGPDKRVGVPGHPEIEMALVALYRLTRKHEYLTLAQFFVDERGKGVLGPNPRFGGSAYYQDRVPIRESTEIEGHAVRALYLTCGVTDVYAETGETSLLDAMLRQWADFVERKQYLTGGAGSRHTGEAFGHAYELPNERAYCETCAAIASVMWNQRLLHLTGEVRFADVLERTLYNGFLSGVALSGDRYFYVNPLLSRGEPELVGRGVPERQPWFVVACCPPNVMRLLASLDQYIAVSTQDGIRIDQYATTSIESDAVRLRVDTDYPWDGRISIVIERSPSTPWALQLRVPGWCREARLNGEPAITRHGYVKVAREWRAGDHVDLQLEMPPRLTQPHPRVEGTHGSLAIERGPLVYCLESTDNPDVLDATLDPDLPLEEVWRPDVLDGVVVVRASGAMSSSADWRGTFRRREDGDGRAARNVGLTAIPYYAWANRGAAAMRVWIPTRD